MTRRHGPIVVALAIATAACAPLHPLDCASGQQAAIQDTLYFGTAKPSGSVGAGEWAAFLEETVTPRFPQGLTVFAASGQWRSADAIATMRQHPEMPGYFERIKAIAQMEATICDVISTVAA